MICSVPQVSITEKLFPSWHLQLSWSCLPRPLVFSCRNVIKTTQKKNIMKIKENAIKIIKERQRKEKRKGDTRRKYLISLPMDALKCHFLSCPPFLLLLLLLLAACHTLLPSWQLPFVMPPHSLACVVLCRLSSLYEL